MFSAESSTAPITSAGCRNLSRGGTIAWDESKGAGDDGRRRNPVVQRDIGVFFRSVGFEDPDAKIVQATVKLRYAFR